MSVVIPCFNVEHYIADCLESVFDQTWPELEVICVDDASTDRTVSILESYTERITLVRSEHRGAPGARNLGLAAAKGEYIQFLDADDLLLPGKITRQAAMFMENPGACFIAGAYQKLDVDGDSTVILPRGGDPWICLAVSRLGITSANLWKRSILLAVGGWDETARSSQEAKLMFRILQQFEGVLFDSGSLTIVRERETGSIRTTHPERYSIRYMNLRLEILEYLERTGRLSSERKEMTAIGILGRSRHLGLSDSALAMAYYRKHLADRLDLENNSLLDGFYRTSLRLIGFPATEWIAGRVRKLVPMAADRLD